MLQRNGSATARGNGMRNGLMRSTALLTVASMLVGQTVPVHAAPEGGVVRAGQAAISQGGGTTTITQGSQRGIIDWQSFGIAAGEHVRFVQPGASAATLNRVTGGDPSALMGRLTANGQVVLTNPHGITIGAGARIDTNGFIASTLDVSDTAFMGGGPLSFLGDSDAAVVNYGTITAAEGDVVLIGHTVRNEGTMSAPEGTAALAAGSEVLYAPASSRRVLVKAGITPEDGSAPDGSEGVVNAGLMEAANAELAAAGGSVYDLAVNQEGVVRATGATVRDGRIILESDGGRVRQAGSITARAGNDGGTVKVGGGYQGNDEAVANASRTLVTADAVIDVDAGGTDGDGGTAIVWSDEATLFQGTATARGGAEAGDGGFVEVSGGWLGFEPAGIDLSAPNGTNGTLLLDPNDIIIQDATTSGTGVTQQTVMGDERFTVSAASTIDTADIETALGSADVEVLTTDGTITVQDPVAWTTNNALRLSAGEDILVNADLTGGATSSVLLDAGGTTVASAPGTTITTGTLSVTNTATFATPAVTFDGALDVGTFAPTVNEIGAITAINSGNRIDTVVIEEDYVSGDITIFDGGGGLTATLNPGTGGGQAQGDLTLRTVGDLTVTSDSEWSYDGTGGLLALEAAGGAFINEAGTSIAAADNSHHLRIYSGDSAGSNLGGITAEQITGKTYTDLAPDSPALTTGTDYVVYSDLAGLTLIFQAASFERAYGDANPALTYTVSGLQAGDTLGAEVTGGVPTLSTPATQASNVGPYVISNDGSALASAKYVLVFQDGQLTVTPAPVTVTVADNSRTYGSATLDAPLSATATGLKNGQTLADLNLAYQYDANVATGATAPGAPLPIRVTVANPNYDLNGLNEGALTIDKAPLTGSIGALTRVYGDTLDAAQVAADDVTWAGFVNGEDAAVLALTLGDQPATGNVGSYALPGSATAANYAVTVTPGTLQITPRPVRLVASNLARFYGDENPELAWSITNLPAFADKGIVSGETIATTATAASDVGAYPITLTGGTTSANYTILGRDDATLEVSRRPISVWIIPRRETWPYTATSAQVITSGLLDGVALSDVLSLDYSYPTGEIPGSYPATVADNSIVNTNYALGRFRADDLTVDRRRIVLTAPTITTSLWPSSFAEPTLTGDTPIGEFVLETRLSDPSATQGPGTFSLTPEIRDGGNRLLSDAFYDIEVREGTLTVQPVSTQLTEEVRLEIEEYETELPSVERDGNPTLQQVPNIGGFTAEEMPGLIDKTRDAVLSQMQGLLTTPGFPDLPEDVRTFITSVLSENGDLTLDDISQWALDPELQDTAQGEAASFIMKMVMPTIATALVNKPRAELTEKEVAYLDALSDRIETRRKQAAAEARERYQIIMEIREKGMTDMTRTMRFDHPDIVGDVAASLGLSMAEKLGATASAGAAAAQFGAYMGMAMAHTKLTLAGAIGAGAGVVAGVTTAALIVGIKGAEVLVEGEGNRIAYENLLAMAEEDVDLVNSVGTESLNAEIALAATMMAYEQPMFTIEG